MATHSSPNMTALQSFLSSFINTTEALKKRLANAASLQGCSLHSLDLETDDINWDEVDVSGAVFLGCSIPDRLRGQLLQRGASIFQPPPQLPYHPLRQQLYNWKELMEGYTDQQDNSLDWRIYQHFRQGRFAPPVLEALWQRIHDHAMDATLRQLLEYDEEGMTQRRCVGIMGGHGVARTDLYYYKTVETAKLLAEHGYFIASGGGPGIMEAANLGAYLAGHSETELGEALSILAAAPKYTDSGYHRCAHDVLERFPNGGESLAIPTWFYGHEPSNLFASHIAKYFSNSLREDTLLAVSLYGIIYAPGSAGTTQEIFMDAAQNHYGTFNYYSPMVFLGRQRYEIDTLIFPLLKQLSHQRSYHELLCLTDEPAEVLSFLQAHPPLKAGN
jgi:predicted Rossmann-fold nucleotide-binding protein